jgi:hypothetical protein
VGDCIYKQVYSPAPLARELRIQSENNHAGTRHTTARIHEDPCRGDWFGV